MKKTGSKTGGSKTSKSEKSGTRNGMAPKTTARSKRAGESGPEKRGSGKKQDEAEEADDQGLGAAEQKGVAGEKGGWTPAKGGRRSEDEDDNADRIPTPRDVAQAKERRDTDDRGGPDA